MARSVLVLSGSVLMLAALGCGQQAADVSQPQPAPVGEAAASQEHTHGAGPHGGVVIDWGGGAYHVEFTVDHDKQEAKVYILGSDEKTPAPIKTETVLLSINEPQFQVDLAAQPLEGEAEGMSSRFVGTHESLGIVKEFSGTISGEVEGTPYADDFHEEPASP